MAVSLRLQRRGVCATNDMAQRYGRGDPAGRPYPFQGVGRGV